MLCWILRLAYTTVAKRSTASKHRDTISKPGLPSGTVAPAQLPRGGDLRTPQSVDKAFCSFQYIVTTSWIIRLRAEDRLLTVRSIYRCPPTHAVSPDYDAIAPVLFILGSHCRCPWRDLEAAIATRKSRGSVSSRSRRRRQPYMAARPSAIDRSAETIR